MRGRGCHERERIRERERLRGDRLRERDRFLIQFPDFVDYMRSVPYFMHVANGWKGVFAK